MQAINKTQMKVTRETEQKIITNEAIRKSSLITNILSNVKKALLSDITIVKPEFSVSRPSDVESYIKDAYEFSLKVKNARITANLKTQTINR